MEREDGTTVERTRGTPQGGVVSPIFVNLFMHYTFDLWMARTYPDLPWCRYADDGLVHCRNEQEAQALMAALQARLTECRLEMHPTKTKMVYCKDGKRKGKYPNIKFDFLGYCFRPRLVQKSRDKTLFCGFNPAVSPSALKSMRAKIRELGIRRRTELSLAEIAYRLNPLLRGIRHYVKRQSTQAHGSTVLSRKRGLSKPGLPDMLARCLGSSRQKQNTGRQRPSWSCMNAGFANAEGTPMRSSSTLSRALFATVILPMIAQPQPLQANPLSPPSASYELTARLELPHLERWGVDKTTLICLSNSRGPDEIPMPVVSANYAASATGSR
jgi:Reverse transcriptase (RNA-dependent DNA polymerase)/Group II intron, maturase-specific domain